MPHDVGAVVSWCRQADRQGLLKGDVCRCEQVAAAISSKYDLLVSRHDAKQWNLKIDDVFETWMMLRFPKAYEAYKSNVESAEESEAIITDENGYIVSQSIADMISKIRASGL